MIIDHEIELYMQYVVNFLNAVLIIQKCHFIIQVAFSLSSVNHIIYLLSMLNSDVYEDLKYSKVNTHQTRSKSIMLTICLSY